MESPLLHSPTAIDYRKVNSVFLAFIAMVGMVFVLMQLFEVLLPLVLASLLSILFKPMMVLLRRRGLPRWASILVVLLCGMVLVGAVSYLFTTGIQSMIIAAPRYQQSLDRLYGSATQSLESLMHRLGRANFKLDLSESIQLSSVTTFLAAGAGSFVSLLINTFLTLLFLIFLMLNHENFPTKIDRAFSTEQSARMSQIIAEVDTEVRRYMVTKTAINLIAASITALVLFAFGVDFALFIASLTFLLGFIPNVGSFIATLFPAVISLLQFESPGLTVLIAGLLIGMHNIIGNFLEPKMMGSNLNLSPLVVLLSLIFWGWVWGAWGMVLAVPVTSIIKISCENITQLRPIAILMSATPPEREDKTKEVVPDSN